MIKRTAKTAKDIICERALYEYEELVKSGAYLGRKTKSKDLITKRIAEAIKNETFNPLFRSTVISVRDEPVNLEQFTNFDTTVCTTSGRYMIMYKPSSCKEVTNGNNYIIGQDLVRIKVRVQHYRQWRYLASKVPELDWVARWCPSLNKELFEIAARHPGIPFPFSPDWVAYAKCVEQKAHERGMTLNAPYVVRMCKKEEIVELNQKYFLNEKRTTKDYENEIKESNELKEVNGNEE